ncbi:NAD(P)/FAD-dependent oxidoreductase [Dermacoccaceae bacterium W4C1]
MKVWDVAVVGASLAGVSVARYLQQYCENSKPLSVLVIGQEEHPPYDRPPLSKEYLEHAGEEHPEPEPLLVDGEDLGASWRFGVGVQSLTPGEPHTLTLSDGSEVLATSVVVATGADARRLPDEPGSGVHVLRTLDDARGLRDALQSAHRVAIVGAGFVGAEVASVARAKGLEVTIVDAAPEPMAAVLGPQIAARVRAEHDRNGTQLRVGVGVAGIDGDDHVEKVRLSDGSILPADLVVVGVGAVPTVQWLSGSGVAVDQGVLVDEHGATSVPGIWAAGDCAQSWDARLGRHVRTEHWTHAITQAAAVARSIAGAPAEPVPVPYVWSHQYGHWIQLAGHPHPDDAVKVLDGDLESGPLVAIYEREGEPVAVLAIDEPRRFTRLRKALQRGLPLE